MNAKKAKSLRKFARQIVKLNPTKNMEEVYKGIKKDYKSNNK